MSTPLTKQEIINKTSIELAEKICQEMKGSKDFEQSIISITVNSIQQAFEDEKTKDSFTNALINGIKQSFRFIKGSNILFYSILSDEKGKEIYSELVQKALSKSVTHTIEVDNFIDYLISEFNTIIREKQNFLFENDGMTGGGDGEVAETLFEGAETVGEGVEGAVGEGAATESEDVAGTTATSKPSAFSNFANSASENLMKTANKITGSKELTFEEKNKVKEINEALSRLPSKKTLEQQKEYHNYYKELAQIHGNVKTVQKHQARIDHVEAKEKYDTAKTEYLDHMKNEPKKPDENSSEEDKKNYETSHNEWKNKLSEKMNNLNDIKQEVKNKKDLVDKVTNTGTLKTGVRKFGKRAGKTVKKGFGTALKGFGITSNSPSTSQPSQETETETSSGGPSDPDQLLNDYTGDLLKGLNKNIGQTKDLIAKKINNSVYSHIRRNPGVVLNSLSHVINSPNTTQNLTGLTLKILICSCLTNNSLLVGSAMQKQFKEHRDKEEENKEQKTDNSQEYVTTNIFINGFTDKLLTELEKKVFLHL
tara:strand:- start:301 stop:1914 length:1614 start_codon:yes stop_codon:yes gene_type:complete